MNKKLNIEDPNNDITQQNNKINALLDLKNRKFDDISDRIEFIKILLGGNKLNPMVDFDMCDTEHVENRTNGYDIRNIMTKKTLDFNKLICESSI